MCDTSNQGLTVVIVGGGLCGLATAIAVQMAGHKAEVLEQHPGPHETGAGLQCSPNGTRILKQLGVNIDHIATPPERLHIRRYDGLKCLASREDYGNEIQQRYGFPLVGLHRRDLQQALTLRARDLGIVISYGRRVTAYDPDTPSIKIESTSNATVSCTVYADLFVVADGAWSHARALLLGNRGDATPAETGDMAHRILLTRQDIAGDYRVLQWMERPQVQIWLGPGAHAAAYPISKGDHVNVVLLSRDDLPPDVVHSTEQIEDVKLRFNDWDQLLRSMIDCASGPVGKWRLHQLPPMQAWGRGRIVLAGDACHTVLPYMGQGFNMALEDAAILGSLLSHLSADSTASKIQEALAMYKGLRSPRVERLREETTTHGNLLHCEEGPVQRQRDVDFSKSFDRDSTWKYPRVQEWLWDYDAHAHAEAAYLKNPF